jgi:hypothetical protein
MSTLLFLVFEQVDQNEEQRRITLVEKNSPTNDRIVYCIVYGKNLETQKPPADALLLC